MILKRIFILAIVSSLCLTVQAQEEKEKGPHFISINLGANIPLSDYQTLDTLDASNVNAGLAFSLEGGAYLNKIFGLGLSVGGFTNKIDQSQLSKQLNKEVHDDGSVSISADDWLNLYAMVGPYLSFGGKLIVVDLKFLGGIINSSKPSVTINASESGEPTIQKNYSESAYAFGFNYGIHLRINLIGGLGLRVNAEGIMSEQEFKNRVDYIRGTTVESTENKLITEFKTLNLGAGLVYTF